MVRSDWSRPYNVGGMLAFGEDTDPWNSPKPILDRLGEFALYDEYDPRRVVTLNDDGSKDTEGEPGKDWLLNFVSDEGPAHLGCVELAPNGDCLVMAFRNSDGNDAMFGDLGNDWLVGGTGQDNMYGGWGNDLLNADDVLGTVNPNSPNNSPGLLPLGGTDETPDTHPTYEDRAYGGAGLDILIGNTGGDRLIDWVGEFNSYIVPFAPFGIATVSRQVNPFLPEFLYALSESDGIDPTRDTDTGNSSARNGEPDGELGLVVQRDHGLWQDQTGGPTDPQPGNVPGGRRDVLRSADFNNGQAQGFFIDSGAWNVSNGRLQIAPEVLGGDAASVFYVDDYLPSYFEMVATINAGKPTAGLKSNAYLIFDYQSPIDFKFAGINISLDKLQMGHRDADGWHVDVQTPIQLKPDTDYEVLLALNGTVATLLVDRSEVFSHTYAPRVDDGFTYGLNAGLVGIGAENSQARIDNVQVQVLPPEFTFAYTENFEDGSADLFSDATAGTWQVGSDGRYMGLPAAGDDQAINPIDLRFGSGLQFASYLELEATLRTDSIAGLVFDQYSDDDFKFAALDVQSGQVILGHHTRNRGWVVDAAVDRPLQAGTDYTLQISLKGAAASVMLDGQVVTGWAFNSAIVDGDFGLLTQSDASSFNDVTVRTNDPGVQPIRFALPGDTDLDWDIDNFDILNILIANKFGAGPSNATWSEGDFDGDGDVDNRDIQLILLTNQFGGVADSYAAASSSTTDESLTTSTSTSEPIEFSSPGVSMPLTAAPNETSDLSGSADPSSFILDQAVDSGGFIDATPGDNVEGADLHFTFNLTTGLDDLHPQRAADITTPFDSGVDASRARTHDLLLADLRGILPHDDLVDDDLARHLSSRWRRLSTEENGDGNTLDREQVRTEIVDEALDAYLRDR